MRPLRRYTVMKTTRWTVLCLASFLLAATSCDTTPHREQQAINEIHTGKAVGCAEEQATIERAVETYILLNPDQPVTEAALVTAGIIHEQSTTMDVMANGAVVPAPGSPCS
jgi:hypothetical protein